MQRQMPSGLEWVVIYFVIRGVLVVVKGVPFLMAGTLSGMKAVIAVGLIALGVLGLAAAYCLFTFAAWGRSLRWCLPW